MLFANKSCNKLDKMAPQTVDNNLFDFKLTGHWITYEFHLHGIIKLKRKIYHSGRCLARKSIKCSVATYLINFQRSNSMLFIHIAFIQYSSARWAYNLYFIHWNVKYIYLFAYIIVKFTTFFDILFLLRKHFRFIPHL